MKERGGGCYVLLFWISILFLVAAELSTNSNQAKAQNGEETQVVPIKTLWGKKYSEAISARDKADQLRSTFENSFSPKFDEQGNEKKIDKTSMEGEAAKVIQAYQDVVDRYPHTEIAFYCAQRLSGIYKYLGKFDKAVELMEQTAKSFAGTTEEKKAIFETGLIHAQARHDPTEAAKWFSRISKPVKDAKASYDEADKIYLSAQQQLTKCELELRQIAEAKQRAEKLTQVFPKYKEELDRSYKFEVDSQTPLKSESSLKKKFQVKNHWNSHLVPFTVVALIVLVAIFIFRQKKRRTL